MKGFPLHHRRYLAAVAVAVVAVAITSPASARPADEERQRVFAAAADEFDVPEELLLALSYLESRWDANGGLPSVSAGYGPMHLTDAATATAGGTHHDHAEDPRGDTSRPTLRPERVDLAASSEPSLRTLDRAAELTGISPEALRADPAANIRGGAALLAEHQRGLGELTDDPADWYGAVARYSGATDVGTARAFADEVYGVLRAGAARTTDDGQRVGLAGAPAEPDRAVLDRMGLAPASTAATDCPAELACQWLPAPYQAIPGGYGNHDKANRPTSQKIDYIVIHDTEASYASTVQSVRNPEYVSWHYTLRSSDGHVAQHVRTKDVAWHAGNWHINAKAIGLEHEGFAAQGSWYTEAMYRTSAKLVKHLAKRYGVPLDRHHIVGHDNVPGLTPERVRQMHWDPGPYWNWAHYFGLLGKPLDADAPPASRVVMIRPDFAANKVGFTGCARPGAPCPARGSTSVILRTEPRDGAPLLKDVGLRPDGARSTMAVSDIGSRVDTGQRFAVAERRGAWTAVWYLGQKGWLRTSATVPVRGDVVRARPGRASVPVYGRAYPEAAAYPAGIAPEPDVALRYRLPAGQRYVLGGAGASEFYKADTLDPAEHVVVRGERYLQIQFGHRFAFVKAAHVEVRAGS